MKFLFLCFCLIVTSCQSKPKIISEITIYHDLKNSLSNKKFVILPLDHQKNDLFFKTYTKIIENYLNKHGLIKSEFQSDIFIFINYGIDIYCVPPSDIAAIEFANSLLQYNNEQAAERARFGRRKSLGDYAAEGISTGLGIGLRSSAQQNYCFYRREFVMHIFEKNSPIYKAIVISDGSGSNLSYVLPFVLKALFDVFTGKNASSTTIDVELE